MIPFYKKTRNPYYILTGDLESLSCLFTQKHKVPLIASKVQ